MAQRGKLVLQIAAVCLVGLLLALLGWRLATREAGENVVNDVAKGETPRAPGFTLPRLVGDGKVDLAAFRGKPVVVNFWASWCVPCRAEAPRLEQAWQRWKGQGVVFLGVDSQDLVGDARHFAKKYDITYTLLHDGPGSTLGHWGVTGFPETWFLNREGKLVGHVAKEISAAELQRNIQLALGSGAEAARASGGGEGS